MTEPTEVKLEPCPACGNTNVAFGVTHRFVICNNDACELVGQNNDPTGEKWNALAAKCKGAGYTREELRKAWGEAILWFTCGQKYFSDDAFAKFISTLPPRAEVAPSEPLYAIFDGPPSHDAGRFVEVETAEGKSVAGPAKWEQYGKHWRLGPFYAKTIKESETCKASA